MQTTAFTPAPYRIRLLGKAALLDQSGRPITSVAGKSMGILCYLALRGRASRDELLALLWGEMDESRARNACRQALHRLRQSAPGLLESDGDMLRIRPDGALIDLLAFHGAVEAQEFEQAAHIYSGDLFDGSEIGEPGFVHWCDVERQRLRAVYHSILIQLTEDAILASRTDVALRWAQAYRTSSPAEAAAALLEAKVLAAAGRRVEAVAGLNSYSERLQREFDLPEPQQISDARKRLTASSSERAAVPPTEPADAVPRAAFIGRKRELDFLYSEWRTVRGGTGRTLSVIGVEGVGKTRLVAAFTDRIVAYEEGIAVCGTEPEPQEALPYAGIAQALRGLLRAPGVGGASEHLLAEASRLLPELRDRYRLPVAASPTDETARLRLFEGVAALIDAVSFEQPVCVVIDHAERMSDATLDLLRYLHVRLNGSAVLFILIAGSEAVWSSRLGLDNENAPVLNVGALAADELEELASALGCDDVPAEDRSRILALAGGSPGKLKEVFRRYVEGGALVSAPVDSASVLSARLAAASGAEKRLFAAAALIGSGAPVRILAAAAHVPEPAALAGTMSLKEAGLLADCGTGCEVPHSNPLGIATRVLGDASLTLMAGWAAEALEYQRYGSHAELARLYKAANRPADALRALRLAADDALGVGAVDDARRFLEEALTLTTDKQQRAGIELLLRALRRQTQKQLAAAPDEQRRRLRFSGGKAAVAATIALVAFAAGFAALRRPTFAQALPLLQDTLFLNTDGNERFANAAVAGRIQITSLNSKKQPPALPWLNPLPGPNGGLVALERLTRQGTDIYLAGVHDTVPLVTGGSDDFALGWSPDGEWLLVARHHALARGDFDADLFAYSAKNGRVLPIDTASTRRVLEAAWSPTGTHIAWVVETNGRRDIMFGRADGSGVRNISNDVARDDHIAWAPDGARLGFTTDRFGNAEIAAYVLATGEVWRLTFNDGVDDHVRFSPDGRYAAFESETPQHDRAIYVVRSWGGKPVRVAGTDAQTAIVGWSGGRHSYEPFTDTFDHAVLAQSWYVLGLPAPHVATRAGESALVLASDAAWESGVLSRQTHPIQVGMTLDARLAYGTVPDSRAIVALVAPDAPALYDERAPQFLRLASVQLLAGGSRIAYSVQREIWTEPLPHPTGSHEPVRFTIRVAEDRTVEFLVDGALRWRSSVRLQDDYGGAQIWIGSSASGTSISADNVSLTYDR